MNYDREDRIPSPNLYIRLQREKNIGEESLMNVGPFELWNAKGRMRWARVEQMATTMRESPRRLPSIPILNSAYIKLK